MKELIKKIVPKKIIILGLEMFISLAIKLYSLKYNPLIIRKGTTDRNVFRGVFMIREFKLPIKINPKLIIDAGAYTGLSTLYYASKYPSAKIIAIEPEQSNFKILEKHTQKLPNVIKINAGLWSKNAFLKIIDMKTGKWGFTVKEVSELDHCCIKAITLEKILRQYGLNKIDILKLDIEGSEKELFSNNYDFWIDKVNIIVIELHDKIISGCRESLYKAIDNKKWNEYKVGEKVILIRKKLL